MEPVKREYPYRPGWLMIVLGGGFFGACALVLGWKAQTNDRGLILNGILEFDEGGATAFYWVLCGLSVGFVVACLFLTIHRLAFRQRLVFTETALVAPRSRWASSEQEIPYSQITALALQEVYGQRFLKVDHAAGLLTIVAAMLPSQEVFDEVHRELRLRTDRARGPQEEPMLRTRRRGRVARPGDPAGGEQP